MESVHDFKFWHYPHSVPYLTVFIYTQHTSKVLDRGQKVDIAIFPFLSALELFLIWNKS